MLQTSLQLLKRVSIIPRLPFSNLRVFFVSKDNLFELYSYVGFLLSLFVHRLSSFGASGRLCFASFACPGYLLIL